MNHMHAFGAVIRWLIAAALATGPVTAMAQGGTPPADGAKGTTEAVAEPVDEKLGEEGSEVEQLAAQARSAYQAGDFRGALNLYLKAYEMAPSASILYNVAVIHDRKLNEKDMAIDFYLKCIKSPDADPGIVRRATERIQDLREEGAGQEQTTVVTVEPQPQPTTPVVIVTQQQPDPQEDSRRTWGWVATGTGGVLFVTGLAFGLSASGKHSDFDSETDLSQKQDLRDSGESRALVGDILGGVGLVGVAAGVYLLMTSDGGDDSAADRNGLNFGLMPTGDGAFVSLGGSL